jgi:hypothetical protein
MLSCNDKKLKFYLFSIWSDPELFAGNLCRMVDMEWLYLCGFKLNLKTREIRTNISHIKKVCDLTE